MTLSRAFVVGLAIGVAVGCSGKPPTVLLPDGGVGANGIGGGTSGTGGGSSDAGLPFRTACTTLNARRCELLKSCGVIDDTTEAYRDCIAWLTATWCGPTKWVPRVERGTLRYDGVRAQTCATDFTTRACSDWATEPASCTRFLSPAVALGGRCYDGYQECTDGVCRGGACPRTCVVRGAIGEACATASDCQSNLFCRPPVVSGPSQCAPYGTEQTPCTPTQLCAPGLLCSLGACRTLPAAEQPCLMGRCDEGAFCLLALDGGQCEARRDAGLSCSDDSQCGVGLVCDGASRACVPALVATIGAECTPQQQCPSGSTCLIESGSTRGTCAAPRRSGEACLSSTDCQGHLACLEADGSRACSPRKKNGSTCTTSRDCLGSSTCLSGSCVALPSLGEACSASLPCRWGACLDATDGGALCIEPQGPGQPCRTGQDCASERCEQGLCTPACLP